MRIPIGIVEEQISEFNRNVIKDTSASTGLVAKNSSIESRMMQCTLIRNGHGLFWLNHWLLQIFLLLLCESIFEDPRPDCRWSIILLVEQLNLVLLTKDQITMPVN